MSIQNVFIIMPFGEESVVAKKEKHAYSKAYFDDLHRILVDAVIGYKKKITVDRMQQPYGNLVSAIIKRLATADVVISVLTGRNPNVFYELGIRHSLRKNTIMLVENWDEYPFDLNSYFSRRYSIKHEADRDDLKTFIKSRLSDLESNTLPDSPVMDVLNTSEFEQLRVINTWETRRAAILVDGLVLETLRIYGIFDQCLKFIHSVDAGKAGKKRPRISLNWIVIEGFTQNRSIPGMPADAYWDAENIFVEWRQMQGSWNSTIDAKGKPDIVILENIIASTERKTVAFLYDLIEAWSYIMEKKACFGIPWAGSMRNVESLIPTKEALVKVREEVLQKADARRAEFKSFDKNFLGVPESMIHEALEIASTRSAGISSVVRPEREGAFKKLVKRASKKPRKRGASRKRSSIKSQSGSASTRRASPAGTPKKTSRPSPKKKARRVAKK